MQLLLLASFLSHGKTLHESNRLAAGHSLVSASLMVGECGLSMALFEFMLSGLAFTPCSQSLHYESQVSFIFSAGMQGHPAA